MTPTRRLVLALLFLFSTYLLLQWTRPVKPPHDGRPPQDGERGPKPYFRRRIVAVGDLHGDLPNALKVFHMAGAVSETGNWTGNVDFLVQTGDIIDRGDDTIVLYQYMENLRVQARDAGGDVLSHLGNHEYMNAIGDWRYVYPSEIKTFGSVAKRQEVLSTGWLGQAWRDNYTVTSRLPLHPSAGYPNDDYDPSTNSALSHSALSFVHGGLSPPFPYLTPYPSAINELGATLLRKLQYRENQPPPHPPNPYPGLPKDASLAEHELYGANGPLWWRGWATDSDTVACASVDGVLRRIGVRRLIVGHTPNFETMVSRCGAKIIIIDTGISQAYGGVLSALEIDYTLSPAERQSFTDKQSVVTAGAAAWIEKEVVKVIYEDKIEVLATSIREINGDFW